MLQKILDIRNKKELRNRPKSARIKLPHKNQVKEGLSLNEQYNTGNAVSSIPNYKPKHYEQMTYPSERVHYPGDDILDKPVHNGITNIVANYPVVYEKTNKEMAALRQVV